MTEYHITICQDISTIHDMYDNILYTVCFLTNSQQESSFPFKNKKIFLLLLFIYWLENKSKLYRYSDLGKHLTVEDLNRIR